MIKPVGYEIHTVNYNRTPSFKGKDGLKLGTVMSVIPSTVTACTVGSGAPFITMVLGVALGLILGGLSASLLEDIIDKLGSNKDNDDQNNDNTPNTGGNLGMYC